MIGEVIFVNKRFSFITSNDNTKYFVRSKNMLTACDKDIVDFSILKGDEVIVNRIITRNTDEFVGVIENSKNFSFVVLDKVLNCLLYTSPSPRDRTRSRMPSSA